jgi:hypothetical protein
MHATFPFLKRLGETKSEIYSATRNVKFALLRRSCFTGRSRRQRLQRIVRDHETFNRSAGDESIHNFRDVCDRNVPVKKVIGFNQNRHTGLALVETARCADARLELRESARGDLLFQGSMHFFRVFQRAASFRVVFGPTIDADKEIAFALHGR